MLRLARWLTSHLYTCLITGGKQVSRHAGSDEYTRETIPCRISIFYFILLLYWYTFYYCENKMHRMAEGAGCAEDFSLALVHPLPPPPTRPVGRHACQAR